MNLYLTAVYNFPGPKEDQGVMFSSSLVRNITSDSYGRILFTILIPQQMNIYAIDCGLNDMGFKPGEALVIMQMSEENRIYFYEDYCFLLETREGFSKESIEKFKERNDWEQPLCPEKMSSRLSGSLFKGMDHVYSYQRETVKSLFPNLDIPRICSFNEDNDGKVVLAVNTYDEATDRFTTFFAIYNPETGIDMAKGVMELKSLDFGEELHELKISNGWDFANCPGA